MKTVTVTAAQPELRKLVEEAFGGTPVVLAYGEKRVKLERYAPASGAVEFDLQEDSSELEAELLKAVRGPFTPYSRQDLEAIAERMHVEKMRRGDSPSGNRSSSSRTWTRSFAGTRWRQVRRLRGAT